jgi:hypothetical protein
MTQHRQTDSYRQKDLRWDSRELRLNSGRLLATVEPDAKWPAMYRVRLPDGQLTDMVNLTRAKDAAMHLVLADLNQHAGRVDGARIRLNDGAGTTPRPKSAPCHDCGVDTAPTSGKRGAILKRDLGKWEWYTVRNDVWAAAGMPPYDETRPEGERGGYLCIGCLENRLGRQIRRADFQHPGEPNDADSARLRDRLTTACSSL